MNQSLLMLNQHLLVRFHRYLFLNSNNTRNGLSCMDTRLTHLVIKYYCFMLEYERYKLSKFLWYGLHEKQDRIYKLLEMVERLFQLCQFILVSSNTKHHSLILGNRDTCTMILLQVLHLMTTLNQSGGNCDGNILYHRIHDIVLQYDNVLVMISQSFVAGIPNNQSTIEKNDSLFDDNSQDYAKQQIKELIQHLKSIDKTDQRVTDFQFIQLLT